MVQRFIDLLHREVRGLHEAAYLLGFFALLSTFLAFFRDRLLAHAFGAGEVLDIYYAAFRIPDIIFVSIASLVSIYVLIPFLTKSGEVDGGQQRLIGNVFLTFSICIGAVGVLMWVMAPYIMPYLFPGLVDSPLYETLIVMTRILLLQPILLGFSNIFASLTQLYGRFVLYAIAPLLYNIGIIVGVVWLYPLFGIYGLAYGVVLGALLHAGIQLPFVLGLGFISFKTLRVRLSEIKNIVLLSLPRTLALSANHVALLVLVGIASLMERGSITVFNFSFNLQAAPLAIIGASYSVAAFPTLARLFSNGDRETFFTHIVTATRHIIFWSVPLIALIVVLRAQIVRVILGSGAFDWSDTRLTAAALALFAVSLVSQGLTLLFVRGYYAAGHTYKPLFVNLFSATLVIVFSYFLTHLFSVSPGWRTFVEHLLRVEGLSGTAVLMLPLAFSLASIVNVLLLWFLFQRDFKGFSASIARVIGETGIAALAMGGVAYYFLSLFDDIFDINTFWGIFAQGFFSGIIAVFVGILILSMLGNPEIREVGRSLHKKFWKAKTLASEEVDL
jgi:putative peptidoglycan lipid II flippase